MRRLAIADTHFDHKNIIKYGNRPFPNVDEMNEKLIANWNSVAKEDDLIYMLGDFSMSKDKEKVKNLTSRLMGRKVLITGNHDYLSPEDYVYCGFEVASNKPIMVEPGVILMHEPFADTSFVEPSYLYIFGHIHIHHDPMEDLPNCRCICVERTDYKPIDLDELIKELRQKQRKNK